MSSLSDRFGSLLLKAALNAAPRRHYRHLLNASKAPREAQSALLTRILASNADTEFGRRHAFGKLRRAEDYRAALPIQTYEDLRPYIESQELTGEKCLTSERPVYYQRTSGTLGLPKYIPVTASGLERLKQQQQIAAFAQSRDSRIFEGKLIGIVGEAIEGQMPGGTPFGSASGLLYENQSRFLLSRSLLPAGLSAIADYEARYLAMAIFGLADPAVTCVATANPSTLNKLLTVINAEAARIIEALASGRLPDVIPERESLSGELSPSADRAKFLAGILKARGRLTYADIWPELKGVVTWTGGSCGPALKSLEGALPDDCRVIELGYLASEFRGTINIDVRRNLCLPTLLDSYFEFVERAAWEDGETPFQGLDELQEGREYYLFVTTADGLYRYDINDIVRVTGRVNATPTLAFVQKGKGVTNITGEKLSESQVLDAVTGTLEELGIRSDFFIMLADVQSACYRLFIEAECAQTSPAADLGAALERRLCKSNLEYDSKRKSGRLAAVRVRWLQCGAGDKYRADRIAEGQRDSQFKYLHLQNAQDCRFDFDALTVSE